MSTNPNYDQHVHVKMRPTYFDNFCDENVKTAANFFVAFQKVVVHFAKKKLDLLDFAKLDSTFCAR